MVEKEGRIEDSSKDSGFDNKVHSCAITRGRKFRKLFVWEEETISSLWNKLNLRCFWDIQMSISYLLN